MAIEIITGFNVGGTSPIDSRLVLDTYAMASIKDTIMPDHYFCINSDFNKLYVYDKSNEREGTYGSNSQEGNFFEIIKDGNIIRYNSKTDIKNSEAPESIGKWRLYEGGGTGELDSEYNPETENLTILIK